MPADQPQYTDSSQLNISTSILGTQGLFTQLLDSSTPSYSFLESPVSSPEVQETSNSSHTHGRVVLNKPEVSNQSVRKPFAFTAVQPRSYPNAANNIEPSEPHAEQVINRVQKSKITAVPVRLYPNAANNVEHSEPHVEQITNRVHKTPSQQGRTNPSAKKNEVSLTMVYGALIKQQRELTTIKNIVMGLSAKHELEDDDDFKDIPYHVSTIESLMNFDAKLKDEIFRKKVQSFMIPFIGENYRRGIKAILSYIGTLGLWSQFSLRGQRKKKSFQELNLYPLIKRVSVKTKGLPYEEIDDAIGDALRRRQFPNNQKRPRTNPGENEDEDVEDV